MEQWLTVTSGPAMSDVTGILVVPPADATSKAPTVLYWLTAKGLMSSPLVNIDETPGASPVAQRPSPTAEPSDADAAQDAERQARRSPDRYRPRGARR